MEFTTNKTILLGGFAFLYMILFSVIIYNSKSSYFTSPTSTQKSALSSVKNTAVGGLIVSLLVLVYVGFTYYSYASSATPLLDNA